MTTIRKKKASKNLVPVGTHVPMTVKLTLQAMAESQNQSMYEFLQETLLGMAADYDEELDKLKSKKGDTTTKNSGSDDGEDLLS